VSPETEQPTNREERNGTRSSKKNQADKNADASAESTGLFAT
jgi:hypothetical protein